MKKKAKKLGIGRCGVFIPGEDRGCDVEVVRVRARGWKGLGRLHLDDVEEEAILHYLPNGQVHTKPGGLSNKDAAEIWKMANAGE